MTDNGKPTLEKPDKKVVLSACGPRWSAKFVGAVTRRDVLKLQRILLVEFAKVQRQNSRKNILAQETARVNSTKEQSSAAAS